jgi:hypothetical protein
MLNASLYLRSPDCVPFNLFLKNDGHSNFSMNIINLMAISCAKTLVITFVSTFWKEANASPLEYATTAEARYAIYDFWVSAMFTDWNVCHRC